MKYIYIINGTLNYTGMCVNNAKSGQSKLYDNVYRDSRQADQCKSVE